MLPASTFSPALQTHKTASIFNQKINAPIIALHGKDAHVESSTRGSAEPKAPCKEIVRLAPR